MDQRISFITLGVGNLQRAREFYVQTLGWQPMKDGDGVVFFQCNGFVLGLFAARDLAEDMGVVHQDCQFKPFSLAYNVQSESEVDALFQDLEQKGARILKKPEKVSWGGYRGYFADSEGHAWEVAYNPFVQFDQTGNVLKHT